MELVKLFRLVPCTAKLHLRFLLRGEQDFAFIWYLKNSYFLRKHIFIFNLSKIFHSSKIGNHLLLGETFPNLTWFSKIVTLLQSDLVRNSLKGQQKSADLHFSIFFFWCSSCIFCSISSFVSSWVPAFLIYMPLYNKFLAEIPFFDWWKNAVWIAVSNSLMQGNIRRVVTLKIVDKDEI